MALPEAQPDDARLREALAGLDADVVGLQEVDVRQPRSGGTDQPAFAAAALGADTWRFEPTVLGAPAVRGWRPATGRPDEASGGPAYGIALVSRLPVRECRR